MGRVNAIRNPVRNRRRLRTSENAAAVPTTVLISVTSNATRIDVLIADCRSGLLAMLEYQCVVQPVIGNIPYRFLFKLKSMSRTIGLKRKT